MTIRYEAQRDDDGARYQSWLRQHIVALQIRQEIRIAKVAEQKRQLDESIDRANREIENLKTQQTIGVVK